MGVSKEAYQYTTWFSPDQNLQENVYIRNEMYEIL